MSILGAIDLLSGTHSVGWIYSKDAGEPLTVRAHLFGRVIGETVAEGPRPDLAAAGLGDGRCGFELYYHQPVPDDLVPFICVKPLGGDVNLPLANTSPYIAQANELRALYPGAGWTRSVYGGLWTDRSDARRILAGRLATGSLPAEAVNVLRDYIDDGYVVLDGAAPLAEDARSRPSAEALADRFFGEPQLTLLKGLFDDLPAIFAVDDVTKVSPFGQPSATADLAAPNEVVALISAGGSGTILVDIIQDSQALPEFTVQGKSRWLENDISAIDLAIASGASIRTIDLGADDLMVVAPGTLYRLRVGSNGLALVCLATAARHSPLRASQSAEVTALHETGALVSVPAEQVAEVA
ncbi:hypothetical protein [Terrihabitans sp. B22-R8]|uniref:hypothetical protein n=1 Tax=Terrihabitans sp. B22-R8 TaxID=3425128 RepID=UPI00403D2352